MTDHSVHAVRYDRRHFLRHVAGASALAIPAMAFTHALRVHADTLQREQKSAILIWLSGGASTIDMWDMKPSAATSGPFRPIPTSSEALICEHLPNLARQMKHLSIVRSMSTREADHNRGRYYLHTGFPLNPSLQHPGYGSVIAHELSPQKPELSIPPFVAIGGGSVGPGFLGMAWAPLVVTSDGRIENLRPIDNAARMQQRMHILRELEIGYARERRGPAAEDHAEVLNRTLQFMTSSQIAAFNVEQEPAARRQRYGNDSFGRGCLLASRLVEAGVPFVEVDFGGWDNHNDIFNTLQNDRLPILDRGLSALLEDLSSSGRLSSTVVICMGEFGRTPRINGNAGRDHWARAWSVVLGGGTLAGGRIIGQTSDDGSQVESEPYAAEDLMASVCRALGISLDTTFTTPSGRPMKIANGGKPIAGLFA